MSVQKKFAFNLGRMKLTTITPPQPFGTRGRSPLDLNDGIPKDYMVAMLNVLVQFRLAITGGTTNGVVAANAPQNIVERFEVSGNHKVYGDWTRYLLQGDHTFVLPRIRRRLNPLASVLVAGVPTPLSGAIGNYDISLNYFIDFILPEIRPEEQLFYLLDCPMWNRLNLYTDWGNAANLIIGGDRTLALSGYNGVGTNPTTSVSRFIAKLQDDRYKLNPIPVKETFRSEKIETSGVADTFFDVINKGNFIRSLIFASGTIATGASAPSSGGDNFATMADNLFSRIRMKRDDVPQRDIDWTSNQQYENARRSGGSLSALPVGWNILDFCEDETVASAYDTREIALNNQRLDLYGDVPVGAVGQRLLMITTELAGIPIFG